MGTPFLGGLKELGDGKERVGRMGVMGSDDRDARM
jgi:hypothetical protein